MMVPGQQQERTRFDRLPCEDFEYENHCHSNIVVDHSFLCVRPPFVLHHPFIHHRRPSRISGPRTRSHAINAIGDPPNQNPQNGILNNKNTVKPTFQSLRLEPDSQRRNNNL
jgi:hypothetical protein